MYFREDYGAIDIWSIPHFLSGIVFGFPVIYIWPNFYTALITFIFITLCWEVVEYFIGAKESWANQIVDVILGVTCFLLGYHIVLNFSEIFLGVIFILSVIVYAIVVIPGWLRYVARKYK